MKEKPVQLYEVIRVIDHIPLFLEDHLERLVHSAELNQVIFVPDRKDFRNKILELIQNEGRMMGNLKLTLTVKDPAVFPELDLDFIPHFYPPEEKYITGVKVGILKAERPNPQAKVRNLELRNKANLIMSKENVFEVLLVDHKNHITEGSRSNVFFVKGNRLCTSPDEKVLQGITRKKVLRLCATHNIPVIKEEIAYKNIQHFEGAFLTGSSPKVLPLYAINDIKLNPGLTLIRKVIDLYEKEIIAYLKTFQSGPRLF